MKPRFKMEKLMNKMIKKYGFENEIVIEFCRMYEKLEPTEENYETLKEFVETHKI